VVRTMARRGQWCETGERASRQAEEGGNKPEAHSEQNNNKCAQYTTTVRWVARSIY
jgi:hypothetical protein